MEILYSNWETSIPRIILNTIKDDYNNFKTFQIAQEWAVEHGKSYTNERKIAKRAIFQTEDFVFINGDKTLNIIGLKDSVNLWRNGLLSAIKNYNPCIIITSDVQLKLDTANIIKSPYVEEGIYYILPCQSDNPLKVDNKIAEFIISEDLTDIEPYGITDERYYGGIKEWVNIIILDISKVVKVI